jgi:hypothetical protein
MKPLLSALSGYIRLPGRGRCKGQCRRRPAFRLRLEVLEDRLAPTVGPLGNEFLVNQVAVINPTLHGQSVAVDSKGQFVEVWATQGVVTDQGVRAWVFNANGSARTDELKITNDSGESTDPSVAIDAQGDFVVSWTDTTNIFAQRFNVTGTSQGSSFQVSRLTAGDQFPGVAMDAQGDFVVSWSSNGQNNQTWGVYARRYNAAGTAQGDEFQVSQVTTVNQFAYWSVAMDAQGDFVISWDYDDVAANIYARLYNATGTPQGNAFQVNQLTTHNGTAHPAMDAQGDFVVSWFSGAFGAPNNVYARRYNAAGTAQGNEFQVNQSPTGVTSNGGQIGARVAMDPQGDFVVSWANLGKDGDGFGVFVRAYYAAGTPQDDEFQVNQFTTQDQNEPSVAMDGQGGLVVTWQSAGQSDGIYARQFVVTARTITFSPATLSAASLNQSYSQTITGMGGIAPYNNFTIGGGALPSGLSLSATGALSGTPTVLGTFTFTVSATDSSTGTNAPYTGSQVYTLDVTDKFSYDGAGKTLTIAADAASNTFTFSQASSQGQLRRRPLDVHLQSERCRAILHGRSGRQGRRERCRGIG